MRPEVPIESIRAQAFEIPTDKPEADGTISWNSTVLVLVEVAASGETGLGYTYSGASIAELISGKLAPIIRGSDAFARNMRGSRCSAPSATWDVKALPPPPSRRSTRRYMI